MDIVTCAKTVMSSVCLSLLSVHLNTVKFVCVLSVHASFFLSPINTAPPPIFVLEESIMIPTAFPMVSTRTHITYILPFTLPTPLMAFAERWIT